MSYRIYNTEGIIISIFPVRESDCSYTIYTKEQGLIRVIAKGVRSMRSKLRYNLQYGSFINVSLVKGKAGWRLVGVQKGVLLKNITRSATTAEIIGRVFLLLSKFVDEGKDECVYNNIRTALIFLDEENLSLEELKVFEMVCSLRLLKDLGYGKQDVEDIVISDRWTKESLLSYIKQTPFLLERLKEVLATI